MLPSDSSEAQIGPGPHTDDALPEILLRIGSSYPINIWCMGLTVGFPILRSYLGLVKLKLLLIGMEVA